MTNGSDQNTGNPVWGTTGNQEPQKNTAETAGQPEQPSEEAAEEARESQEVAFRPLTRSERRNLWLKEYGEQDFALQMWARLVEQQDLEIEMMFQMPGLLVFGVMVSTARYAQFYIDLNEELHRERDPDTADALGPVLAGQGQPGRRLRRGCHARRITMCMIEVPMVKTVTSAVEAPLFLLWPVPLA